MSVRARPSAPRIFKAYRLTGAVGLLCIVALLATFLGGCERSPSSPETSISGDVSEHTAAEIVELVRTDLTGSPTTGDQGVAADHVREGDDHRWASQYGDPKTWTVELIVPGEDSLDVYRWEVADYNSRVSFLGVFRGSVIESVQ